MVAAMTVDPTSELAENVTETPHCGSCETPVGYDPDHRVVTWVEADTVHTEHFCTPACRQEFLQDKSGSQ